MEFDLLPQSEAECYLQLGDEEKYVMKMLWIAMVLVLAAYDAGFLKRIDAHEVGTEDSFPGVRDLLLMKYSYIVQREGQEDGLDHYIFTTKEMVGLVEFS